MSLEASNALPAEASNALPAEASNALPAEASNALPVKCRGNGGGNGKVDGFFAQGTKIISTKNDEDRWCSFVLNRGNEAGIDAGCALEEDLAVFGVFDGHGGTYAADVCARELVPRTVAEILTLTEAAKNREDSDVLPRGSLLCAAADKASMDMNVIVQDTDKSSGTTSCVLYLQKTLEGAVTASCVNTGDSRCVLIDYDKLASSGYRVAEMSSDHSAVAESEVGRINRRSFRPAVIPSSPNYTSKFHTGGSKDCYHGDSDPAMIQRTHSSMRKLMLSRLSRRPSTDIRTKLDYLISSLILQNEHLRNVGSLAEDLDGTSHTRSSSVTVQECKLGDFMDTLPCEVFLSLSEDEETFLQAADPLTCYSSQSASSSNIKEACQMPGVHSFSSTSLDALSRISSKEDVGDTSAKNLNTRIDSNKDAIIRHTTEECVQDIGNIVRKESFIARRTNASGEATGPPALFGQHKVSTLMTRSIGDRLAARACIPNPDVTSIDISAHKFARFIVASDGLWDVVTSQAAADLIAGISDPKYAAEVLVQAGRKGRKKHQKRMDDITVSVVDVHPHLRGPVGLASMDSMCSCTSSSSRCTIC